MTYKDNNQNYNAGNRKLVNFKGFDADEEKEELRDIQKGQIKKNDPDTQSQEHRRKMRWNKVTHKIEDLHPLEVDDKVDELEELEESNVKKFNEYLDPMGDWDQDQTESDLKSLTLNEEEILIVKEALIGFLDKVYSNRPELELDENESKCLDGLISKFKINIENI